MVQVGDTVYWCENVKSYFTICRGIVASKGSCVIVKIRILDECKYFNLDYEEVFLTEDEAVNYFTTYQYEGIRRVGF